MEQRVLDTFAGIVQGEGAEQRALQKIKDKNKIRKKVSVVESGDAILKRINTMNSLKIPVKAQQKEKKKVKVPYKNILDSDSLPAKV